MVNIYQTQTLLKAVQSMPKAHTFLVDTFFPTPETFLTEEVLLDVKKGKRKMAPFVAPRVGGVTIAREGYKTQKITAPRLAPQRAMTVDDVTARLIGESIVSNLTPQQRQLRLLADDLVDLQDSITRRKEWLAAQVLFEGKAVLQGYADQNGDVTIEQVIDFEFTQTEILSGTDLWTDASSDPYANFSEWRKQIIKECGVAPTIAVLGENAYQSLINNSKFMEKFNKFNANFGKIEPSVENEAITFVGKIPGLGLELYTYDDWYLDEDGVENPFVPANKVLLAVAKKGGFAYGAITQIDSKTQKFMTYEGEMVPKQWADTSNEQIMVRLSSRPVPKPFDVNSWLVATVI
jgi:hypothetical protein